MNIHRLYLPGQSAYRKFHSTETALVRATIDIMMNMNRQHVTLLAMLGLSSVFDTVDHDILLGRLNQEFGMNERVLEWFTSYLSIAPCKVIQESGILFLLAWNPESKYLRIPESRAQLFQIKNKYASWNSESTTGPESKAWKPESKQWDLEST